VFVKTSTLSKLNFWTDRFTAVRASNGAEVSIMNNETLGFMQKGVEDWEMVERTLSGVSLKTQGRKQAAVLM
jgi:hypothetical protein